jgi:hypothetical protein
MEMKCAGCDNEEIPVVVGTNTQDKLVIFGAVNKGEKKLDAGSIGKQSKLMMLPVNKTCGDENA